MKTLFFVLPFFILSLFSCSNLEEKEEVIYQLPDSAVTLLAGKGFRTWKLAKRFNGNMRVNMGDCTLAYRQTFHTNQQLSDNNAENDDCGASLKASWRFSLDSKGQAYLALSSKLIPSLFKVKEGSETKFFKIISLSDSQFVYKYPHQLFSKETTIITDILIPEDAPDGDRNLHW